jgi:hypothetical protein
MGLPARSSQMMGTIDSGGVDGEVMPRRSPAGDTL